MIDDIKQAFCQQRAVVVEGDLPLPLVVVVQTLQVCNNNPIQPCNYLYHVTPKMVGGRMDPSTAERERQGTLARSKHLTPEIYFLITKFLSDGPCQRALQAMREEIEEHKASICENYSVRFFTCLLFAAHAKTYRLVRQAAFTYLR